MKLPVLLLSAFCAFSILKMPTASGANSDPSHAALDHHNIHFETVNIQSLLMEHGSLGSIMSITQDEDGFIWIGGEFGLARFDGHQYHVYRRNPTDGTSLCGNYVRDIEFDRLGHMWVATTSGLCRYISSEDRFQSYGIGNSAESSLIGTDIAELVVDDDNHLYVGTSKGMSILSADRAHFIAHYTYGDGPTGLTDERVEALHLSGNNLWIGTIKGLNRLDLANQTIERIRHEPGDPASLPHDDIRAIAQDKEGYLWLAALGGGLIRMDTVTRQFIQYTHDRSNDTSISGDTLHSLYIDRSGRVWALTDSAGLSLYRPGSNDFIAFRREAQNASSLTSDKIRAMFEDNLGDLWIGSFEGGLQLLNKDAALIHKYTHRENHRNSLPNDAVLDIQQDAEGKIWIGTENGAAVLNPSDSKITQIPYDPSVSQGLRAGAVLSIEPGTGNDIWIGTWSGGLHRYDKTSGGFVSLIENNPEANINSPFVWDLLLDSEQRLWIATQTGGLNMLDTRSGSMHYFLHDADDPATISWNFVYALAQDKTRNELWIATNLGLNRLDLDTLTNPTFTRYLHSPLQADSISDDRVTCLLIRSTGEVWVGTENGGIDVYHRSRDAFEHIFSEGELPSNNITSMVEDAEGYVWITTPNGVARVDPDARRHLKTYYKHHGLAGHTFNRDASLLSRDGDVYLGSTTGVSRISRQLQGAMSIVPQPLITGVQVNYSSLRPGENQILKAPAHRTASIELGHFQNALYFEFSSMTFRAPIYNLYRYRLAGFDHQWHETRQPTANYTNLDPGGYIFEVHSADSDGNWSQVPAKLAAIIRPPYWRSGWAYTLYGLFCIGLISWLYHYIATLRRSREYKHLSHYDVLTDIYNRSGTEVYVRQYLAGARNQGEYALLIIDIDRFKTINDTLGHNVGDLVLQSVARLIKGSIRHTDILGRWGGDEMVLLVAQLKPQAAQVVAANIQRTIRNNNFNLNSSSAKVTLSIGIAYSQPKESWEDLLERADKALYRAKQEGRDTTVDVSSSGRYTNIEHTADADRQPK